MTDKCFVLSAAASSVAMPALMHLAPETLSLESEEDRIGGDFFQLEAGFDFLSFMQHPAVDPGHAFCGVR